MYLSTYKFKCEPFWIIPFLLLLFIININQRNFVLSHKLPPLRPPSERVNIDYKTTYACDGFMLNLNCPLDSSVHLVRANYGRFSLSICNEGGKLDLRVNCMSYRSFLTMQDRCSGKSNCNVTVSSDLFGDPCPGTSKYLEVQYYCKQMALYSTTRRPPTALPVDHGINRPSKPIDQEIGSSSPLSPSSSSPSSSSSSSSNDKSDGITDTFQHQHHHHHNKNNSFINNNSNFNSNSNDNNNADSKKGQSSTSPADDSRLSSSRSNHVRHGHGHNSRSNLPSGHSHHTIEPSTANPLLIGDSQFNINSSVQSSSSPSSSTFPFNHLPSKPHSRFPNSPSSLSEENSSNLDGIVNPFGSRSSSSPSSSPSSTSTSSSESSPLYHSPSNVASPSSAVLYAPRQSIEIGGRFCPPTFRRSLNWNYTSLGDTYIQNCPGGAAGLARWHCSELTGTWTVGGPDMLECRSYWLDSLWDKLERGSLSVDISTNLANMTIGKPIFSRDLETISNLIRQIILHARETKGWEMPRWQPNAFLEELLTSLVYSVSNLLSPAQDEAWLDLVPEKRKRIAFNLLDELEKSALLLAENTNRDGYFTVKRPNVLVAVHVLETNVPINLQFPTIEDTFDTEWIRMEDSLFLPSQSLLQYSNQGFSRASFIAYNRVEDLLKPGSALTDPRLSKLQSYSTSQSSIINSRIIGAAIVRHGTSNVALSSTSTSSSPIDSHTPLTSPIIIVFRHLQEDNVSSPKCVYWSRELSDWLTEGCSVAATNNTHTVCQCNHLSSFALLMENRLSSLSSSNSFNLNGENSANWLRLVVIIGSGISALCLLFILMILYTIHGDNRELLSIHKDLCLTLLIVQVTFFIGIFQTDNLLPCILSAGILHYFLLSAFLWTFLESFDHFLNLIDVFETLKRTHRLWWYYCLAFGGPGLITLLSIFINPHSYGSSGYCWLRPDVTLWLTLVGPCILALIASLVFICISAFIVCHNSAISTALKGKEQLKVEDIRCGLKWIAFLLLLQSINWITCYAYLTNQTSIPLGLSFASTNCLLGFYCILFCIIRTDSVQHHKIAQHLPLMDWCFDGSESETSNKESVFTGANGLAHHSSLYGPSPVIPVVTHVTTQVSPYSDGQIRTFKSSHVINNTLALYESIESPSPPLNNLQQQQQQQSANHHLHHHNIIPSAPTGTLIGNTNGTSTFVSMSSSSSSSSAASNGAQVKQQNNLHNYHQIQPQQQQQLQQQQQQHQLIAAHHHHNNVSLGVYQSTLPGTTTNNLNLSNSGITGGGSTVHRNHSSLMLNNSLGLYESIEPPSPAASPTPYHHTSRNQIYLGHGSLSQHGVTNHLIGTTGRKHRMLIPSDFSV